MGKGKRHGKAAPAVAERHDFVTGGLLGHDAGDYHVNVSERTALGIDAVYACVRTLADAVSSSRVVEFRDEDRIEPPSRIVRRPMSTMTRREWLWLVTATMALYNRCPVRRIGSDSDGVPLSLVPITPPERLIRLGSRLTLDGREDVNPDDVFVIRRTVWPSVTDELGSLLKLAREVFAAAWAQGAYTSDFWENGGAPQIIITSDQPLSNPDADGIRDRWTTTRRDHPGAPAVMGKGATVKGLGVDLAATGSGEAGDRLLSSIARYFGVAPWVVNVPTASGSMTYSNTEMAGTDLVRYGLSGYLGPIADAWSDELPGDSVFVGRRVELDVSHLTAGTLKERYEAYQIATGGKPFMTEAEVRRELHLPVDMGLDPRGASAPALELIPGGAPNG